MILDPNFWCIFLYRISTFFSKIRIYPIAKLFWLINRILFTVDIDPRSDIAGGLVGIHFQNIVIGHEVRTLGPVKIYHGVTIGGNMGKRGSILGRTTGQPVIESNVTIGLNSVLLGPVHIGMNSTIGASTIVTKNIPKNSIVRGEQNLIIKSANKVD